MCFRLTDAHMDPNNWQKMSVFRAAQVFSRHIAMAFRHYREKLSTALDFACNYICLYHFRSLLTVWCFIDTAPTERMTKML